MVLRPANAAFALLGQRACTRPRGVGGSRVVQGIRLPACYCCLKTTPLDNPGDQREDKTSKRWTEYVGASAHAG